MSIMYCSTYKCNRTATKGSLHGLVTGTGKPLCEQCYAAASKVNHDLANSKQEEHGQQKDLGQSPAEL